MRITLIFFVLFVICGAVNAQSKKEIKKHHIVTRTEFEQRFDDGNIKVKESFRKFDTRGNLIEEIDYTKEGEVKDRKTYEFDENNNLVKEIKYEPNGNIDEIIEYKYKDGLKTEKLEYDFKGRLIKKKTYIYEFEE